jgi:hypothetical protein
MRSASFCCTTRAAPIAGTSRWLAGRRIAMHHHVALDEPGDFDRLARFVHGTALGLVACGAAPTARPTSVCTKRWSSRA